MPAVDRAKPGDYFSKEEWAALRRVSPWRGIALVAHAWGVITLSLAVCALAPHPVTYVFAVVVIGSRQLGLAILMHEAAHGLLHPSRRVNDFLGRWLCGAPVGADLQAYRDYHLKHHKYAQQDEDPDLWLSNPYPVSRYSLIRKILRDLTGQTFIKQMGGLVIAASGAAESGQTVASRRALAPFLAFNAAFAIGLFLAGYGWLFLIWLAARASWFQLVFRVRNIAEHACTSHDPDPLKHARTTRASLIERWVVAPYWVNYHVEHHLFMYLPCYRLPAVHQRLVETGASKTMTIAPNYFALLYSVAPHSAAG